MAKSEMGKGVIVGKDVEFGDGVVIWNYVVIGDNTKIGHRTQIGSFCDIGKRVTIGEDCIIQAHVTISNECRLESNIFVGPNSSLLNDKFPHSKCLTPSTVEDHVVIGGCVTILPGLTVGKNSVIAAGSVVTRDVQPGTVVKGIPAKPMMTRQEYESKRENFIKTAEKKNSG